MSKADQIREFAHTRYVALARKRGDAEITVRAGDIHRDMKLVSAMPAVCSALGSKKFSELTGVSLVERRGPPQGANVYFRFSLRGGPRGRQLCAETEQTPSPSVSDRMAQKPESQRAVDAAPRRDPNLDGALVLVSCVKSKLTHAAPARELYVSPLFQKMRAFAERAGSPWFILSARYGLVSPDKKIEPYELTLNKMGIAERRAWGQSVTQALAPHLDGIERVIFLAGARYREFLAAPLRQRGITVQVPMEGLAFGEQLAWLSRS